MLTKQLIEILSSQDPESEVLLFWDGGARGDVEGVYTEKDGKHTKKGRVVLVGEWSIYRRHIEKDSLIIFG